MTVGSYYNSERRQRYYGGYTFKPFDHLPRLDVTAGLVSGYRAKRFTPFMLPSYTVYESDDGVHVRLGFFATHGVVSASQCDAHDGGKAVLAQGLAHASIPALIAFHPTSRVYVQA